MLLFNKDPDIIFTEILTRAFEASLDFVQDLIEEGGDFSEYYPWAARVFTKDQVFELLPKLLEAHLSEDLWEINDFHFCLIHDMLKDYCVAQNEIAQEIKEPLFSVEDSAIRRIDFEKILFHFFYGTDFQMDRETMDLLTEAEKTEAGIQPETYSIVMGFKPDKEDLEIKRYPEEGPFVPGEPEESVYEKGEGTYPSKGD